ALQDLRQKPSRSHGRGGGSPPTRGGWRSGRGRSGIPPIGTGRGGLPRERDFRPIKAGGGRRGRISSRRFRGGRQMTEDQLSALWLSIEEAGAREVTASRFLDTGASFPTGAVLAGVDGMNQRHLCIPAPPGELGREDRRSCGVTIEVRPLVNPDGHEVP